MKLLKLPARKAASQKRVSAFAEPMIIESIQIEKKEAIDYICGKAAGVFNDDFYYAYHYEKGRLNFVVVRSASHLTGNYTVFAPALLKPGKYYFHSEESGNYYNVTNDKAGLSVIVDPHEKIADAYNLSDDSLLNSLESIPDTLKLQWSLAKHAFNAMALLAPALALSILAYGYFLFQLKTLPTPSQVVKTTNGDISVPIKKVGDILINGNGTILKIVSDGKNVSFTIKFNDEYNARQFLSKVGGDLNADGKVIYTAPFSGGG